MKINKIQNRALSLLFIAVLSVMTVLASCNDDEEVSVDQVSLTFPADSVTFDENGGESKTAIVLSEAAKGLGSVTIQLSGATYGTDYTTIPDGSSGSVTIEVEEGTLFRSFSLIPADNNELDGDKFVTLTMAEPTGSVELGNQTTIVLTIDDDERPAPIDFALNDQMVAENAGTVDIVVNLEFAALAAGSFDVAVEGSNYGGDYTTAPSGESGSFTVNVERGATSASFGINTIDNEVVDGNDRKVTFTISNATNGLELGDNLTHEVTIADDESPVLINFKETAQAISENNTALTVDIEFAMEAEAPGSFDITLSGGAYGTDYSTDPDGMTGTISVAVAKGDLAKSITLTSIDNFQITDQNPAVTLMLGNASGGVELGTKTSLEVTLEDDEMPVTATFAESEISIREDGGEREIIIILSEPAQADATIEVAIGSNGVYGTDYTTTPDGSTGIATVNIARGDTQGSFTYLPTDNSEVNTTIVSTSLTLQNPSAALTLGDDVLQIIRLIDEEIPVVISFDESSASVVENGDAVTVELSIQSETLIPGTIQIDLTGQDAAYGTEYTTSPDGSSGNLTLEVPAGSTSASFTVTPVNNDIAAGTRSVTFTLGATTGSLTLGSGNRTYELVITDKDRAITDISTVRALFNGTDEVVIADETVIRGVVISDAGANADQTIIVQDATAGIIVNFTEAHSFERGTEVEIDLAGSVLTSINSLVQIARDLPLTSALATNTNQLPTPTVVSITDALSGSFESQLVSVENVFFIEADGTATLSGDNTLSDGTDQLTNTVSTTSFQNDVIPLGTGTITGILSNFNGTVNILPQIAADIFDNNPTVALTVTGTINDFGSIDTDAASTPQTITVEGTGLLDDITIDAPANFEVSLSEASGYVNDLILDQSTTGVTTVYVRFAPTSAVEGVKSGNLTISTLQATSTNIEVSGTETSAGPANLLLVENFDYGTTEGPFVNDGAGIGTDNWEAHSGNGNNPHNYVNSSLSLTGYPSSGVGGSLSTSTTEDININFADVTSGKVYASALVSVSPDATTSNNGEYFLHFKVSGEFTFYGRVTIKDDGAGNLLFGVRENSGTRSFSSTNYAYDTVYMVVLVYDFSTGAAQLHVLDNVPATEPVPVAVSDDDAFNGDATLLNELAIRGDSDNPAIAIDGIRVGLDWDSIIGN
ncbi:MAG: DUF5689 domain-containing protein [Bacteroidota bacterium]